jgi:hypothetical protein
MGRTQPATSGRFAIYWMPGNEAQKDCVALTVVKTGHHGSAAGAGHWCTLIKFKVFGGGAMIETLLGGLLGGAFPLGT